MRCVFRAVLDIVDCFCSRRKRKQIDNSSGCGPCLLDVVRARADTRKSVFIISLYGRCDREKMRDRDRETRNKCLGQMKHWFDVMKCEMPLIDSIEIIFGAQRYVDAFIDFILCSPGMRRL